MCLSFSVKGKDFQNYGKSSASVSSEVMLKGKHFIFVIYSHLRAVLGSNNSHQVSNSLIKYIN